MLFACVHDDVAQSHRDASEVESACSIAATAAGFIMAVSMDHRAVSNVSFCSAIMFVVSAMFYVWGFTTEFSAQFPASPENPPSHLK